MDGRFTPPVRPNEQAIYHTLPSSRDFIMAIIATFTLSPSLNASRMISPFLLRSTGDDIISLDVLRSLVTPQTPSFLPSPPELPAVISS